MRPKTSFFLFSSSQHFNHLIAILALSSKLDHLYLQSEILELLQKLKASDYRFDNETSIMVTIVNLANIVAKFVDPRQKKCWSLHPNLPPGERMLRWTFRGSMSGSTRWHLLIIVIASFKSHFTSDNQLIWSNYAWHVVISSFNSEHRIQNIRWSDDSMIRRIFW